jgi:hypothetical protein
MFDTVDLDNRPMAGWHEFQAARRRVADRMWVDSQLHRIVNPKPAAPPHMTDTSSECQLHDATD